VSRRLLGFSIALVLGLLPGARAAQAAARIVFDGAEFRVQESATISLAPAADYQDIFQIEVDGADGQPMAGSYRLEGGTLIFRPQFPLQPGVTYNARYRLGEERASASFSIPKPVLEASTEVDAIFPTRNVLPANQLKLYIHFSAPMSRGSASQRIHLFDESGIEVQLPFLRLAEELWDGDFRRLTLLFDPGRIKRGLLSQQELGMALHSGRKYTLVIDESWPDARGVSLKRGFTKQFSVGEDDRTALDPKDWRVAPPPAGTSEALTVEFPEPLDQALATRVLAVKDARGKLVDGTIVVDREETRWSFTPSAAWRAGGYEISVPGILEDLAGNKVYTPFDVDVKVMPNAPGPSKVYAVPFQVSAR
jgi:hypothetical protein